MHEGQEVVESRAGKVKGWWGQGVVGVKGWWSQRGGGMGDGGGEGVGWWESRGVGMGWWGSRGGRGLGWRLGVKGRGW